MNIESSNEEIGDKFENLSILKPDSDAGFKDMASSSRSHFTSIDGPPKIYEDVMR